MIRMVSLKCPECGALLSVEDSRKQCFCQYCGAKIIIDDNSTSHTYRKVDEARIKEAETNASIRFKELDMEEKNKRRDVKIGIAIAVAFLAFWVILFGGIGSEERKSKKQEAELQQLVEEIQVDIDNGDFDDAYIKAQSIKYTENWSDEIEDKWDNIRKEVIDQIIQAEKEATGKSKHKSEKDGLFDWLFN